jgi:hypothetical protein
MANSPEQLVGNQVLLREVNERIAEIASSSAGDPPEFLCECSRNDCSETLALALPEYERIRSSPNLFVLAPGHECPEVDRVVEARHDSHLVEKTKHLELVFSWARITPAKGVSENGRPQ